MPSAELKRTVAAIKSLHIQGASKVRNAVVRAVRSTAQGSKAKTVHSLRRELRQALLLLVTARPTEPDTRTAGRILLKAINSDADYPEELKEAITNACANYEKNRKLAMQKIAEFGAKKIPKGSTVMTHCHSHTVENILVKARRNIKEVICTETRPLFQGRITAKALARAGINTTLIVDSAAARFMRSAEPDIFITGCDAILADGSIVNKIGTRAISLAAAHEDVPHYVATSSHSFDPLTYFGEEEPIEERPAKEVWQKGKPARVKIRNPAFDVTDADYVKGIICELGVLAPETFTTIMYQQLGLARKKEKEISLIAMLGRR